MFILINCKCNIWFTINDIWQNKNVRTFFLYRTLNWKQLNLQILLVNYYDNTNNNNSSINSHVNRNIHNKRTTDDSNFTNKRICNNDNNVRNNNNKCVTIINSNKHITMINNDNGNEYNRGWWVVRCLDYVFHYFYLII